MFACPETYSPEHIIAKYGYTWPALPMAKWLGTENCKTGEIDFQLFTKVKDHLYILFKNES